MEIKLKKEEEDRILRRKRVEAIMLRTRTQGKGSANALIKVCLFYINNVDIIPITVFYFIYNYWLLIFLQEKTETAEQQGEEKTEKLLSDPMTTSQGPVSSTEAMLVAEINHSSPLLTMSLPSEAFSNGLLLQSTDGPKQNGHTNGSENITVHHSNGHLTTNGNVFNSSDV